MMFVPNLFQKMNSVMRRYHKNVIMNLLYLIYVSLNLIISRIRIIDSLILGKKLRLHQPFHHQI